ncbi:MAG: metallophosphoesterase [Verrucomicrobiota bacterium]
MNRRTFLTSTAAVSTLAAAATQRTVGAETAPAAKRPATKVPAGAWTIAVLPDTQYLSRVHPDEFLRQTTWVVANRVERNILFALHEGDITDRNSHPEWMAARTAMNVLRDANLPFVMVQGNHDFGDWGMSNTRRSHFSDYFIRDDCFGSVKQGFFEVGKMDNTYRTFATPWGPFLIVALEFGPRDEVVEWATKIVAEFPDHHAVLLTHSYLYYDSTRYDYAAKADKQTWSNRSYAMSGVSSMNDGEQMWQKLVSKHPNFLFTLNGHVLRNGTGYLVSKGQAGNDVHQLLVNYQKGVTPNRGASGGAYLRLMTFFPDKKTVEVSAYSPVFDQWLEEPDHKFTMEIGPRMLGAAKPATKGKV